MVDNKGDFHIVSNFKYGRNSTSAIRKTRSKRSKSINNFTNVVDPQLQMDQ